MWRTIKWLLIVGALIVWGLTDFASTLVTCQQEQQEKAQQSPEKGCGFADSLTAGAIKDTAEWIDTRHDLVTAAATIVIAFFTFTLWRATNKLWDAGERQLNHLSETAERQLRAYVFIEINELEHAASEMKITVDFCNRGQTPAHNLIQKAYVAVHSYPLVDDFEWPEISPIESKRSIPPLGEITSCLSGELPAPLANVTLKETRLYLFAAATYTDVFNGKHRTTVGGYFDGPEFGNRDEGVPTFRFIEKYCESD